MTPLSEGAELEKLSLPPISRSTLALFAGASGDHNSIHIDIDVAKSVGLEDVFAQGMLSMAYLARMLTNNVPVERIRSFEVKFVAITPLYGEPTCSGRVRRVDATSSERIAIVDVEVKLADGTVTLIGSAEVSSMPLDESS